jgi:glycosyltransferase involved in cell wall biosynthesis
MAIDCFLAQDYPRKELVILDDGVSPTSVPSHPDIRYFRHTGLHLTIGAKRNAVNELTLGSIICNWDDDDWSGPSRVATQVERIRTSGKAFSGLDDLYFLERDGTACKMERCHGGAGTTQCYTRAFWEAHQFPDIPSTEDVHFCQSAEAEEQVDLISGLGLVVVHRHALNIWDELNKLDRLRCSSVSVGDLPPGFLQAMGLHPPYPPPRTMTHFRYGVAPE